MYEARGLLPRAHVSVVYLLREIQVYPLYLRGDDCCAGTESDVKKLEQVLDWA